jgi:predicted protein tyrosine phosphatase
MFINKLDEVKSIVKCYVTISRSTKSIVGAANQWSSHVIVRSDVMKSVIYTARQLEFCVGNLNLTISRMK